MSRIHDALKRAEQERARGGEPTAPASTAGAMPREAEAETTGAPSGYQIPPSLLEGAGVGAGVSAAPAADLTAGLTLQQLEASCPQTRWSPDPVTMLFFGAESHHPGAEEFRTLRSRLYQARQKAPLQRIVVSSALPAEGKSFVAANLAQVIVRQHGRSALLIDADLRWSRLHQYLGTPSAPGLTDYLRGDADEFSAIQRGPTRNLFFMPGGKAVSNPAELIHSPRMKQLLQRLSSAFDWIIIDSPPAVPVTDASLIADLCDGVLLVVEADSTPLEMAQKARQEFGSKTILGVVLNRVAAKSTYSHYYYGYGQKKPS